MKLKKITIENLAIMVKKGFDGTDQKIEKGFKNVEKEFRRVDEKFKEVDEKFRMVEEGFKGINDRLDKIENFILKQHSQKIEILEKRIYRLEEALSIK